MWLGGISEEADVVNLAAMDDRPADQEAGLPTHSHHSAEESETAAHLDLEVAFILMVLLEIVWPGANLSSPNGQGIHSEPVHAILVIEPVLVGVWVRWGSDDQRDPIWQIGWLYAQNVSI